MEYGVKFCMESFRGCHFDNYPNAKYAGSSPARTSYGDCMVEMNDFRMANAHLITVRKPKFRRTVARRSAVRKVLHGKAAFVCQPSFTGKA